MSEVISYIEKQIMDFAPAPQVWTAGEVIDLNVNTTSINVTELNQLILLVRVTLGSHQDMWIKVEYSNDGVTWYTSGDNQTTAGSNTINVYPTIYNIKFEGNVQIAIPIKAERIRISGMVDNLSIRGSALRITAVLGTM